MPLITKKPMPLITNKPMPLLIKKQKRHNMKPEDKKEVEQIKREINKGGVHTATNPVNDYKQ